VRPASEVERRRLNDLFAELCAIPSVSRDERACADRVTAELRGLGLEVIEDGAGAEVGANAGNLLARMPGRSERSILLCSHLDTVPHGDIPIEPVVEDGGWIKLGTGLRCGLGLHFWFSRLLVPFGGSEPQGLGLRGRRNMLADLLLGKLHLANFELGQTFEA